MSKQPTYIYDLTPIPGAESGCAALQIYKPGTFFGHDDQHAVFVGGCGVGHAPTLEDAKALLLQRAKEYCRRQIDDALSIAAHYKSQLAKLETRGLVRMHRPTRKANKKGAKS